MLLALVVAYLGVVSVWLQVTPEHRALGLSGTRPYSHPLLLGLAAALCANLLAASLSRIPLDLPRLAAWCSHAGIFVLLAGTLWYAAGSEKGQALTGLMDDPSDPSAQLVAR